jgi:hypothetical protein
MDGSIGMEGPHSRKNEIGPGNLPGPILSGAEDGIRTRDLLLGKEMLYH